jgi:hypothetical protein
MVVLFGVGPLQARFTRDRHYRHIGDRPDGLRPRVIGHPTMARRASIEKRRDGGSHRGDGHGDLIVQRPPSRQVPCGWRAKLLFAVAIRADDVRATPGRRTTASDPSELHALRFSPTPTGAGLSSAPYLLDRTGTSGRLRLVGARAFGVLRR